MESATRSPWRIASTRRPTSSLGCQPPPRPRSRRACRSVVRSSPNRGHRLVRGERTVGEPRRDPRLLDQRVGQPGRVRRQDEDRAHRADRDEPESQAGPGGERGRGDPPGSELGDGGRRRVRVGRGEERVEERQAERGEPDGRDRADQVVGRDAAGGQTEHDGGGQDDERREDLDRGREADEPADRDRELEHRARPAEEAVELGRRQVAGDDHAATPSTRRSPVIRPASSVTMREARSPTSRPSWVAATRQTPSSRRSPRISRSPS